MQYHDISFKFYAFNSELKMLEISHLNLHLWFSLLRTLSCPLHLLQVRSSEPCRGSLAAPPLPPWPQQETRDLLTLLDINLTHSPQLVREGLKKRFKKVWNFPHLGSPPSVVKCGFFFYFGFRTIIRELSKNNIFFPFMMTYRTFLELNWNGMLFSWLR